MKTAKQICADAADIIREKGWSQGSLMDDLGRVCLLGALQLAAFGCVEPTDRDYKVEYSRAKALIDSYIPPSGLDGDGDPYCLPIEEFNDLASTNVETVLDILEEASK